jgi:WD40 repeat protein
VRTSERRGPSHATPCLGAVFQFESKSPRVKGVAFRTYSFLVSIVSTEDASLTAGSACLVALVGSPTDPKQPLLAASLHNGTIQLWNYQMGTLVERYEEHDGQFLSSSQVPKLVRGRGRGRGPGRLRRFGFRCPPPPSSRCRPC